MAYDRYDTRDERSRWRSERPDRESWARGLDRDRDWDRDRNDPNDRGFFERAGDEVASWFGDDEAERRRQQDRMRDERELGFDRDRDWRREDCGRFFGRESWGSRDRDFNRGWRERDRDYRPMTGDYGRSERESGEPPLSDYGRPESRYGRDEYRRTSFASSLFGERDRDPHYRSWRDRHMSELDRDYDEYRRENQSRFEDDFGSWRERRQQKRGLLGQIREHMEVVGNDDLHVGTVDRAAGDRIILTRSDPESGGIHHSLSCSDIDRVEGDRIVLDCSAEQARQRWRDESRSRALFEREDQGEMGPRLLDRSFEGTYR